jgi:hypothetical protein
MAAATGFSHSKEALGQSFSVAIFFHNIFLSFFSLAYGQSHSTQQNTNPFKNPFLCFISTAHFFYFSGHKPLALREDAWPRPQSSMAFCRAK